MYFPAIFLNVYFLNLSALKIDILAGWLYMRVRLYFRTAMTELHMDKKILTMYLETHFHQIILITPFPVPAGTLLFVL